MCLKEKIIMLIIVVSIMMSILFLQRFEYNNKPYVKDSQRAYCEMISKGRPSTP